MAPPDRVDVGDASDIGQDTDLRDTTDTAQDDIVLDTGPLEPARMQVTPGAISFENVILGNVANQTVAISNVGESVLRISSVNLVQLYRTSDLEFTKGSDWLEAHAEIAPNTFREFTVHYEPKGHGPASGRLEILSNDPEQREYVVGIETISHYPHLEGPKSIQFGAVVPQASETRQFALYNRGINPLTITDLVLDGSAAYEVHAPTGLPAFLNRREHLLVELTYTPTDSNPDRGTLTVVSNDPGQEAYQILLLGNGDTPCISATHAIDFGRVDIGESSSEPVLVLNCGTVEPLQLSSIELIDDGGGVFTLGELPELPQTLAPGLTTTFDVLATPDADGEFSGAVRVRSDDPDRADLILSLRLLAE